MLDLYLGCRRCLRCLVLGFCKFVLLFFVGCWVFEVCSGFWGVLVSECFAVCVCLILGVFEVFAS